MKNVAWLLIPFIILNLITLSIILSKRAKPQIIKTINQQKIIPSPAQEKPSPKIYGVNISGGEFGPENLPGVMNTDYLYPQNASEYQYYANKHISVIRLPIRWERIQHGAFEELYAPDMTQIKNVLKTANQYNMKVIIDLHNFGRYYGQPLSVKDTDKLSDVWTKLAETLKNDPGLYGYELMNEPHDLPGGSLTWSGIAQNTTNAIRKVDKKTLILIPGYNWQNAQNWTKNNPQLPIRDPGNNVTYAAHIYFDNSFDGKYINSFEGDKRDTNAGVRDSSDFRNWLKTNNVKGIFTEFGVPAKDPGWLTTMDIFLENIHKDKSLMGAIYWSGGPWWKTYSLSIEPINGSDRPQMKILQKYTAL